MFSGNVLHERRVRLGFDRQLQDRVQLKRNGSRVSLVFAAPPQAKIPVDFDEVRHAPERHATLIDEMQRLRGRIYLQDGAIEASQLSRDGRHQLAIDQDSWHLLMLDQGGSVCGCVRYRAHENTADFGDLWVRHSALASHSTWRSRFRAAVESELGESRRRGLAFVEVGGWALAHEVRATTEALRTALATYSLAQSLGGCIGITTATVRHGSSSMLRRIGGRSLQDKSGEIPAYHDPQYGCEMEVLRFDSARVDERYAACVQGLRMDLRAVPVISPTPPRIHCPAALRNIPAPAVPRRSMLLLQPA